MARTPIVTMIDRAGLRCTVCDTPQGGCDCWSECSCGWSFRKGQTCRNPVHLGRLLWLECPVCQQKRQVERQTHDPKRASRLLYPCGPKCEAVADDKEPRYFNPAGKAVPL